LEPDLCFEGRPLLLQLLLMLRASRESPFASLMLIWRLLSKCFPSAQLERPFEWRKGQSITRIGGRFWTFGEFLALEKRRKCENLRAKSEVAHNCKELGEKRDLAKEKRGKKRGKNNIYVNT